MYEEGINPFSSIKHIFENSDYVIGNLECMVKGGNGENELKKPRLTTTLNTLNYLKTINLNVACLAQNHVYDHLEDGFKKTIDYLNDNGIQHLGAGFSLDEASKSLILEKNGISVGILNYVTSDTNPNLPENASIFLNIFNLEKCIDDIKLVKGKVDHLVLSLHWGGKVEGGYFPDWDQPRIARKLINAGADLIIGHHTHTVQPFEVYKGKHIFYSLGNFCFSDYNFNGKIYVIPYRGMVTFVVNVSFTLPSYDIELIYYLNQVTSFSQINNYSKKIQTLNKYFGLLRNNKFVWNIYYLHKQTVLPLLLFWKQKDLSYYSKLWRLVKYIIKTIKNF